MPITDDNYPEASKILSERYENMRHIITAHWKAFCAVPAMSQESPTHLRKLLDNAVEQTRALRVLGQPVDHWDTILVISITEKLDPETRKQWELVQLSNKTPSFKDLSHFMQQRCSALEAAHASKAKSNVRAATHITTQPNVKCSLCSQPHEVFRCSNFANLPVPQRIDFVKKNSLCFNCLRSGHSAKVCKSGRCRKCLKSHHTSLHLSEPSTKESSGGEVKTQSSASNHFSQSNGPHALLATALVNVKNRDGGLVQLRALLDSGSQISCVTSSAVKKLKLPTTTTDLPLTGIGGSLSTNVRKSVNLLVSSRVSTYSANLSAYVLPQITTYLPNGDVNVKEMDQILSLKLADPKFHHSGPVDVLLGADIFFEILLYGQLNLSNARPVAQNSQLGWLVSGRLPEDSTLSTKPFSGALCVTKLDKMLEKFWECENHPEKENTTTDTWCDNWFQNNHYCDPDGRYVVKLPFVNESNPLGYSKAAAVQRLQQVERRLNKNVEMKRLYCDFMNEYATLGHMSRLEEEDREIPCDKSFYLPHHCVLKESSSSTKLRVVFDGSCKSSTGVSLNDKLAVGPKIQDDLTSILLRFREHPVVLKADVSKMYRQIRVDPSETNYQRIVTKNPKTGAIDAWKLNTVTYGTSSAPYTAIKCIQQLAHDEKQTFPRASEITLRDFYVDDLLTGCDDETQAIRLTKNLISLFECGGFELKKWVSNSKAVMSSLPSDLQEISTHQDINFSDSVTALGIRWYPVSDQFSYTNLHVEPVSVITKRHITSQIAKLYDPLGWVSPVVLCGKILLQSLWTQELGWDEPVTDQIREQWSSIVTSISAVHQIKIPRWYGLKSHYKFELHGFCDASEKAYGACVYIKISNPDVRVCLITSKTKVAPVKSISLPRLELCGALLLSKLLKFVKSSLLRTPEKIYCWCDSMIVLWWIRSSPQRLKTFVSNRISTIQQLTSDAEWRHVVSQDNPADLASRGSSTAVLINCDLWWTGPNWLMENKDMWPQTKLVIPSADDEAKSIHVVSNTCASSDVIITRFSNLKCLEKVFAWCLRFADNCRRDCKQNGPLQIEEKEKALLRCCRVVQQSYFHAEVQQLKKSGNVSANSRLKTLNPFIDQVGIIRVGGRLSNSTLPYNVKFPIVLPKSCHLSSLIVQNVHANLCHGSINAVICGVREKYWVLSLKSLVRKEIQSCIKCFRTRNHNSNQMMGNLPTARVEPARPFVKTGLDYAAPFLVKRDKIRKSKQLKVYVCVFVCFTSKAVHLELVSDLTSESCIATLKRFMARRGQPMELYSDNATTFVGANREFMENAQAKFSQAATDNQIAWKFIPPASPNFGGLWESAVKSMKGYLKRVLGNQILTYEEFSTLIVLVEAALNSRPLCAIDDDPNSLDPLTPAHFLIGHSLFMPVQPDMKPLKVSRLSRWQRLEQMHQHLWSRWSKEYLHTLQQRTKWNKPKTNVRVNDLVLLKEENQPPLHWKLGRIIKLYSGNDNLVRVVDIKTSTGVLKRCISKVCVLPIDNE